MELYLVNWGIDIEADSPEEAAKLALEIQRDADSDAVFFEVEHKKSKIVYNVDLSNGQTSEGTRIENAIARLEDSGISTMCSCDRLYIMVNDIPLELSEFEIDFQSDEWIKEEGYNNV